MTSGETSNFDEVFTVERILRKRRRKGRCEFLIKWKGYGSRHNTWEPDDNIFDRGLIYAFEANRRKRRRRRPKPYTEPEPSVSRQEVVCAEGKPRRRHVVIEESSSGSEIEKEDLENPKTEIGVERVSSELQPENSSCRNRGIEIANSDDDDDVEIARNRRVSASFPKKRLFDDSSSFYSDHLNDDAHGDDEHEESEDGRNKETFSHQPIRLTIRHSFCTLKDSSVFGDPMVLTATTSAQKPSKRRRKRSKKKKIEDYVDSDFSSSASDDEKRKVVKKSRKKLRRSSASSKVPMKPAADSLDPPELQVMVSDSELWFINERNTKHKQESALASVTDEDKCGPASTAVDRNSTDDCAKGEASSEESDSRLDVVVTDVKAHNYTVVIKECYKPVGFFQSAA